jgi:5-methylcytosine-specific restriction enzyme A
MNKSSQFNLSRFDISAFLAKTYKANDKRFHRLSLMIFEPNLQKDQLIDNQYLCSIFKCSPQGGMRRSLKTNTLVVISDQTKRVYRDLWKDGVLLYTGMGLAGDQNLDYGQNRTLKESPDNGVRVFLFEITLPGLYKCRGEVKLVGEPYQSKQSDKNGLSRMVWIFPLKLI